MKNVNKFLIIGGDKRQLYLARYMINLGYSAELFGFELLDGSNDIKSKHSELKQAVEDAQAIILPLPVSTDGVIINTPFGKHSQTLEKLSSCLDRDRIVFAGMMSNAWKSNFFKKGIKVYDYFEREELIVKNAIPTAQGVIKIAFENLPITLHGSKCLVTGYGRTAKVIAKMLSAMGAIVTVSARKCSDSAWANADGHSAIYLKDLHKENRDYDILVNTVPTLVIDKEILKNLNPECLIVDISSSPYGIDFAAAEDLGLKVIVAGSLPGKVAPKTAGEIIGDAIINIIKEGSE